MQLNGQTVTTSWLQSPDARDRPALLEYTRGVLYSLTFSSEGNNTKGWPIHSARIRNAFSNLGAPTLYRLGLKLLQLLREVEPLFGGYWLLSPLRVIKIESHYIFVGAVPSTLGRLGDVRHEGLARFLSEEAASRFPRQTINGWAGLLVAPVAEQVASFVSAHRQQAEPTLHARDIEFFKVVGNDVRGRRFVWTQQPHAIVGAERIALCRQKRAGIYRYFSADLRDQTVFAEAPIDQSLARLMFALANFTGFPVSVKVRQQVVRTNITVSERLPIEEYRLALLLAANVSRLGSATSYSIETSLAPALLKRLSSLGCFLEISN